MRHLADKVEKVIKLYPTVAINYRLPLTRPEFQNSSLMAYTPPHCLKFEAAKCKYLGDDGAALLRTFEFLICNLDISFLKLGQSESITSITRMLNGTCSIFGTYCTMM